MKGKKRSHLENCQRVCAVCWNKCSQSARPVEITLIKKFCNWQLYVELGFLSFRDMPIVSVQANKGASKTTLTSVNGRESDPTFNQANSAWWQEHYATPNTCEANVITSWASWRSGENLYHFNCLNPPLLQSSQPILLICPPPPPHIK